MIIYKGHGYLGVIIDWDVEARPPVDETEVSSDKQALK
jgi:hypothetical protein